MLSLKIDCDFIREQVLGESHHPLLFRKGKRLKDEGKRREPPPDTPVVDVSVILMFYELWRSISSFVVIYNNKKIYIL